MAVNVANWALSPGDPPLTAYDAPRLNPTPGSHWPRDEDDDYEGIDYSDDIIWGPPMTLMMVDPFGAHSSDDDDEDSCEY